MNEPELIVEPATPADLSAVLELLARVELPAEGVAEFIESFIVARDAAAGGRIVGCVGLERHGETALLRSAAVAPEAQGTGLGLCLTAALLDRARAAGVREVVLLTTTARDFFARKFDFAEAPRADYDARLAASPEWRLLRCASAVCMKLEL
ncbi:MAG: amino-acid N-acetyltransferase [Pyrinomonadaceae bacterium]|jgi:amino-acid N-acetyltransferase|nr:amino-acid N-acetyltransferase [Pyrinomonadaceae bacterium]